MFIPIWDTDGTDEGYLNLDTLDRFKLEKLSGSPTEVNLVTKKGAFTKVWRISGNSYQNIKEHMNQFGY